VSKYYLILIVAVFITAFCQLLLKLGALHGKTRGSLIHSYLNPYTIVGYFLMFIVTLLNTYAYKYVELKINVILLPMTFVLVALLSFWVLKENFSKNQVIGSAIILAGIVVFNF